MEGENRVIIISKSEASKWFSLFYTVKLSEIERKQYFRKNIRFPITKAISQVVFAA